MRPIIVETAGATTTKAMQQKIHNLRRCAGGVSAGAFAVLAVGRPVSESIRTVGSEAAIIQYENRGRLVKNQTNT